MPRRTANPPIRSAPKHKVRLPARNAPGHRSDAKLTLSGCEEAYHLTRVGGTMQDVAIALKTTLPTVVQWMKRFPEFRQAVEGGRAARDEQIVSALFHRARGYEHKAEKIFCQNGVVTKVEYTERYPPDAASAIFWLKNRQPDDWKDVSQKEISGPDGGPIEIQHLVVKAEELGQKIRGMTFDAEAVEEKPA